MSDKKSDGVYIREHEYTKIMNYKTKYFILQGNL